MIPPLGIFPRMSCTYMDEEEWMGGSIDEQPKTRPSTMVHTDGTSNERRFGPTTDHLITTLGWLLLLRLALTACERRSGCQKPVMEDAW